MKTLKKLVFTLLLSSLTLQANDYALVESYPLIHDLKVAEKQVATIEAMRQAILKNKHSNTRETLSKLKNNFTVTLAGLRTGNRKLHLKGTKVIILKNKIKFIELLWEQEQSILDSAINNTMYNEDALATLNGLNKQIAQLNKLYSNSYARYKQNSIMKTLVRNYMRDQIISEPKYAFNTIK